MECNNCGNSAAYRMHFSEFGACCDKCGTLSSVTHPDVFFRGPYLDPHLIDTMKPEQKNGVWIESLGQKAAIMQKLGVHELGDRRHGGRVEDKPTMRREFERLQR